MLVELTLRNLPAAPLELRLSRTSPGRYALHDFARNVRDLEALDEQNRPVSLTHASPTEWTVPSPPSSLTVRYELAGDRLDGTWLSIDDEHAHINMPAALVWVRGLERSSTTVRFDPPASSHWQVATQLFATPIEHTYTAPNLQYLMDSPAELSAFSLRTFVVEDGPRRPLFRLALHHRGGEDEVTALARDAEAIARQARGVFGRFPAFEGGAYTFLVDLLPGARNDGMEHRNCAVVTARSLPAADAAARTVVLESIAHEFFHAWNVERIRPSALEPFDFERANVTSELWLAEGFTEYYGPLLVRRAGLTSLSDFSRDLGTTVSRVEASRAPALRTVEDASRMAPLVDGAADPSARPPEYLSYYAWGRVIALALDLALRERSSGRVTLDHFMRALWERFGTSGEREPGYVLRGYTRDDVRATLASVSGDARFADEFLRRYVQGHEVPEYRRLLELAGLVFQPVADRPNASTLVTAESAGRTLTPEQRSFRDAWLGPSGMTASR